MSIDADIEILPNVSTGALRPTRYRWVISAVLLITVAIAYMDRLNVAVLIADPQFLAALHINGDPVKMGMLMSVFLVAYGFSSKFRV
jgi:sugar phosphate permease